MGTKKYEWNIFLNIPFDDEFESLKAALIFTVYDCGFIPRCALEMDNSGQIRFEKICSLIDESKFSVHDLSRTELDQINTLPRFNMPFELGLFLGAKYFGTARHKSKNCLVLDKDRFRYQKFISDLAGCDIRAHDEIPEKLISKVRDWLNSATEKKPIPGGKAISKRYVQFCKDLPRMCQLIHIEIDEITYVDFCSFVEEWLKVNAPGK